MRRKEIEKMETRSRTRTISRQELREQREAALQRIAEHEQAIKRIREEITRTRQSYKATLEKLNAVKAHLKSTEDDLVSSYSVLKHLSLSSHFSGLFD